MEQQLRTKAQAMKVFEKALDRVAYSEGIWNVFEDFLSFSLLMLRWQDLKPEHFQELENRYPKKEQHQLFAEAFTAMADIAHNDGEGFHDVFGDYFMEHFSNKFKGQFFTPQPICDMMAQLTMSSDVADGTSVCDPTCGSGRTLIAAAKINRKMIFYGADVDINCCKMTVINMMLNTMCGEVAWMDSLAMKHWRSWHIRKVFNGVGYVPYYIETGPGETHFIERLKNSLQEKEQAQEEQMKVGKKNQLLLF